MKMNIKRLAALIVGGAILFSAGLAAAEDNNTEARITLQSQSRIQVFGAHEDDDVVFANSFPIGGKGFSQSEMLMRHGR